jgi:hypothetical protein
MVKSTRRSLGGTDNKDDEFDASSDVPIVSSSLSRNLRSPILGQGIKLESTRHPPYITRASKQPPASRPSFINTIKGRLAWEYPARAQVKSQRPNGFLKTGQPPAFWAWLASRGDFLSKSVFSRFQNHYLKERELDRANLSTMISCPVD